jgi:hypothetical protein
MKQPSARVAKYNNFTGLNNHADPLDVGVRAFIESRNVDFTDTGCVGTRQGYQQVYSGTGCHSVFGDGDDLYFREGQTLKVMDASAGITTLKSGLTAAEARMSFLRIHNRLICCDGVNGLVIDDNGIRDWGMQRPPAPALTETAGNLAAGRYLVAATYIGEDGQESGASNIMSIDITKGGFNAEFTGLCTDSISFVHFYVSYYGGDILYYSGLSPISTTVTFNWVSSIRPSNQGQALETKWLSPPPMMGGNTLLEYYRGRVFYASGEILWYSEPYAYELFNVRESFFMFDSPITLLAAVYDGIFIATETASFFMQGTTPEEMGLKKIADYGAIFGSQAKGNPEKEMQGVNNVWYWDTPRGKCAGMDGGQFLNMSWDVCSVPTGRQGAGLFWQTGGQAFYVCTNSDIDAGEWNRFSKDIDVRVQFPDLYVSDGGGQITYSDFTVEGIGG